MAFDSTPLHFYRACTFYLIRAVMGCIGKRKAALLGHLVLKLFVAVGETKQLQ